MATRTQVEAKIAGINDGGNNSAAEVRDVLSNLLDYTENIPFPSVQDIEFFHFWTDDKPVSDKLQNILWYSIKGIKDQWINFTFTIEINKTSASATSNSSNNVYAFPLQDKDLKVIEYLKNIVLLNEPSVRFLIPYTTMLNEQLIDYPLSTSIYFQDNNIIFDFNNNLMIKNNSELGIATGKASSSVSFHYPFSAKKLK
jgi:hypothetical protein